ncbi:AAA family ATPase [Streptomyces bathyalis]|uniref:AAA family ATPase n=1 Tax=Streptomyces bathyalis TaxID=2710756 RepID=A0A7T1T8M6_9ACTN|nr:AAA family ATPase [Streptomyces bathyalis]QPP08432.1 AAA family ATPase [Streptomyces bathyalis]
MSRDAIPVLWLCGPPGVGKTAVGWELYSRCARAGTGTAYVDIDQLGMCSPESASDPGRHRMKARNLGALVANFGQSGARRVIVSGVVDAERGPPLDQLPGAAVTVCRLRAGRGDLKRRLEARGSQGDDAAEDALRESDALDAGDFADLCIDTSGLPVAEVARLVRERTGGWPLFTGPGRASAGTRPDGHPVTAADGRILWLCGATGVGKSTVGFEVYQKALRAGHAAAYVDVGQLGFCGPVMADDPGNHRVKARNLAALWQTFRAAGARRLIVVGPVEDEDTIRTYAGELPAATLTLCRLRASRDRLAERILQRGQGGSWAQPGDPLKGRSTAHLLRVADRAAAEADVLERAAIGDLSVDTDRRTVEEVADAVVARTGWTSAAGRAGHTGAARKSR